MSTLKISNLEVKFPKENPYKVQVKFMEKVLETVKKTYQHAILEGPTGMGKTLCMLSPLLAWRESIDTKPKIFFCSRTLNQINNVVKELKTLSAFYKIKVVVKSSKKNYCIHPDLEDSAKTYENSIQFCMDRINLTTRLKFNSSDSLTEEKTNVELGPPLCGYYFDETKKPKDFAMSKGKFLQSIKNTDEVKIWGRSEELCPFFQTRALEAEADVVCLNYNYLLSRYTRIDLKNAIIVMDEAHNIDEVCENNYSDKWSDLFLKKVKDKIWEFEASKTNPEKCKYPEYEWKSTSLDTLVAISFLNYFQKVFFKYKEKLIGLMSHWDYEDEKIYEKFFKLDYKTLSDDFDSFTEGDIYGTFLEERKAGKISQFFREFFHRRFANVFEEGEKDSEIELNLYLEDFSHYTPEKKYKINKNEKEAFFEKYSKTRKFPIAEVYECMKRIQKETFKITEESLHPLRKFYFLVKLVAEIITKVKKEHYSHFSIIFMLKPKNSSMSDKNPLDQEPAKITKKESKIMQCLSSLNGRKFPKKNNQENPRARKLNCKVVLHLVCLSPHIAFKDLRIKGVRNIFLTSGTLSPFEQVESQLGFRFDIKKSFKPVADIKRNFFSGIITCIRKNQPFRLVRPKDNAQELYEDLLQNVGRAVLEIVNRTPNGTLLFFSSYRVYTECLTVWNKFHIFQQLNERKYIVLEEPEVDLGDRIKLYEEKARSEKGAMLFGVCGGRLSEGFNFTDELARAVIIIGLPLRNLGAYKVKLKMEYLDQRTDTTYKGRQWYSLQAMRSINQAVGRVLRHSCDWGAAFLIDERMQQNIAMLSKWIKEHICVGKLQEVLGNLGDFFERSRTKYDDRFSKSYSKFLEDLDYDEFFDSPRLSAPDSKQPGHDKLASMDQEAVNSEFEYDCEMIDQEIKKHLNQQDDELGQEIREEPIINHTNPRNFPPLEGEESKQAETINYMHPDLPSGSPLRKSDSMQFMDPPEIRNESQIKIEDVQENHRTLALNSFEYLPPPQDLVENNSPNDNKSIKDEEFQTCSENISITNIEDYELDKIIKMELDKKLPNSMSLEGSYLYEDDQMKAAESVDVDEIKKVLLHMKMELDEKNSESE